MSAQQTTWLVPGHHVSAPISRGGWCPREGLNWEAIDDGGGPPAENMPGAPSDDCREGMWWSDEVGG